MRICIKKFVYKHRGLNRGEKMEDNQIVERFWACSESALLAVSEKYERFCKAIARNIFGKEQSAEEFPSIFKSGHIKHTDMVEILTGHEIKVEFDRPTPLSDRRRNNSGCHFIHRTLVNLGKIKAHRSRNSSRKLIRGNVRL